MKILYVTTISNTINSFLIPHIKFLIEKGNRVDVACNIVERISPEIIRIGCKVHNVEFQRHPFKKDNFSAYRKIRKIIISEGYELIHTHTPIASFLTRLTCKKMSNVKKLYTAHGFHFFKGAPLKNWFIYYSLEKISARYTDGLITINEEDYQMAKKLKLCKNNSIFKMHGVGIDLNKFQPPLISEKNELRQRYGFKVKDFILFYAAELNHNKHQDLLIEVINSLKFKIPNIKLLLAGTGSLMKEYKAYIKKLGIEEKIIFLGHRKDISTLLKIVDVAVASSRREGLPVNVMEAMAIGLPLVVTDCRGHRDLIKHGYNGYLVNIEDVNSFAEAIMKIYESKKLVQVFSKRSIELVNSYSLQNVISEMNQVYSHYLKG